MKSGRAWGFTLIELLAVIAIIGILVGLTAAILPRALEKARVTRTETDFNQIRTTLAQYYTENSSFPIAYGYRTWASRGRSRGDLPDASFFSLQAYIDLQSVELRGTYDLYDEFSLSYDSNENGSIEHFEFSPTPGWDVGAEALYESFVSAAEQDLADNVAKREVAARPYIYIPVNLSQAKVAKLYYESHQDYRAATWGPNLTFPPPRYDAYVLISVGPRRNTCGLVCPPANVLSAIASAVPAEDLYHVIGLRAYYLATRDLNENGLADYDFRARTRQNEGKPESYPDEFADYEVWLMPGQNLAGPLIFSQQG